MFPVEATEKINTYMGTDYFFRIEPKRKKLQWNQWQTTSTEKLQGKNWDTETKSRWMNRYGPTQCATILAACPKDGTKHTGTDIIELVLHKDKPKYRRAAYVRAVCYIIPYKT